MIIDIEAELARIPLARKYMECFPEIFLTIRQCIAALLLCMRFPEMKGSVGCVKRTAVNLHNVDLTALGPLPIKAFICRHHPECRQESFSTWHFCSYLKTPILEIMFFLCVDSSRCIIRLSVNYFFDRLNIQHTILYIGIFLRVHIRLQLCIYPSWLVIFKIPVVEIEFLPVKIIFPYKLICWIHWKIWFIRFRLIRLLWRKLWNLPDIFCSAAAAHLFFAPRCTLCCTNIHFPLSKIMPQWRYDLLFLSITFRTYIGHKTTLRTCWFPVVLLCPLPVMCIAVRDNDMAYRSHTVCCHPDICLAVIFRSDHALLHGGCLRV